MVRRIEQPSNFPEVDRLVNEYRSGAGFNGLAER
jgi:hypothetical protein